MHLLQSDNINIYLRKLRFKQKAEAQLRKLSLFSCDPQKSVNVLEIWFT